MREPAAGFRLLNVALKLTTVCCVMFFCLMRAIENADMAFQTLDPGRLSTDDQVWGMRSARVSIAYSEFIRKNLLKRPSEKISISVPEKTQSDINFVQNLRTKVLNNYLFPSSVRAPENYHFELTSLQKQQLDKMPVTSEHFGRNVFRILSDVPAHTSYRWGIFIFEAGDITYIYPLPFNDQNWFGDA